MTDKLAMLGGRPTCRGIPTVLTNYSQAEEQAAIEALRKGLTVFTNPVQKKFENRFASLIHTKYAISVSSGTSAMIIALCSLKLILPKISYVLIPAYSYIALVNAVRFAGLKYKLIDNSDTTFSASPESLRRYLASDAASIVLLPYMFGLPPAPEVISSMLENPGRKLVEDCALGLGTKIHDSMKPAGSFGIGCFTFAEPKTITCAGEGGMISTDDGEVAKIARAISHQGLVWSADRRPYIGTSPTYYEMHHKIDCYFAGMTSRMTSLQAALGIVQLKKLDVANYARWRHASRLVKHMKKYRHLIRFPTFDTGNRLGMNLLPGILCSDFLCSRDTLLECLKLEGVPASIYSARPLFEYSLVKDTCSNSVSSKRYPVANSIAKRHVLLPVYPSLSERDISCVALALEKVITNLSEPDTAKRAEARAMMKIRAA